jgi:hypothetical protein
VACASIWLAYGLFVGFPNLIFMMGACVVVTFIVLFTAELLSMVRLHLLQLICEYIDCNPFSPGEASRDQQLVSTVRIRHLLGMG